MVGNKAQKAVAAALTGVLAFGGIAPAFAGVWTGNEGDSWYRINGDHQVDYQLGTLNDDDKLSGSGYKATGVAVSGTEVAKGENRYDTMFDAIYYNAGLYQGTKYVVLASGQSQADTLVAAGVAGMLARDDNNGIDVPVIITPTDKLCVQAERAIKWAANEFVAANKDKTYEDFTVYIVGGEAAVSADVQDAVEDIEKDDKAIKVERLAGDDRVATSLEAAKVVDDDGWLDEDLASFQNYIYVANGKAWPDALSVSSSAYSAGRPILLTGADGKLSADQIEYLKKQDKTVNINVIGGPALPSQQQLFDEGFTRARVAYTGGENRYETSAAVIEWLNSFGARFGAIAVASGTEAHWADALIGGAFVGANGGVVALVDGVDEVTALKEAYAAKKKNGTNAEDKAKAGQFAFIMGGEAAIDAKFADKLNKNFPVA